MARVSTRENKNIYQLTRENLKLTRETASELLESIPPERIEKIENERSFPHPDEVRTMAEKYKKPDLCNYYCANQCPIGQEYVPEIKIKDLSQIVLEMLASLNAMNKRKDRLIEITADGKISDDELEDFLYIQEELERISITVETLQLWAEKMLAATREFRHTPSGPMYVDALSAPLARIGRSDVKRSSRISLSKSCMERS